MTVAGETLKEALRIVIHELDGIPLYNDDVEAAGAPASVVQLRDAVRVSNALGECVTKLDSVS